MISHLPINMCKHALINVYLLVGYITIIAAVSSKPKIKTTRESQRHLQIDSPAFNYLSCFTHFMREDLAIPPFVR